MTENNGRPPEGAPLPQSAAQGALTQAVLDSLEYPFYAIEACTHRIRLANRAAQRMSGPNGTTCHAMMHRRATPCDGPDHPCPMDLVVKTKQPAMVEHVHHNPDGRPHNVEVHAFPIFDEAGEVVQILEYCIDLDERQRAEHEIGRLNEQLERRVHERTAELKTANNRLQEESHRRHLLERDLLEISEREQRRIGLELHDSLGQLLTGVAIMSKALEQKLRRKEMPEADDAGQIARLVNSAVEETRQLSRGLHPVTLDENGLMSALEALAETTQSVFRVSCAFRCRQAVPVHEASTAVHLYRIAQEAVTRAIRHGETQNIQIELSAADARATLTITYDGRCFETPSGECGGIALQMMRHRAEMAGGALDVQPGPDGGTKIICTLDMRSRANEGEIEHGLTDASQDKPA